MKKPRRRRSGILLHPTSLPGPLGIGTLGRHARAFVDWLAAAGQELWQLMPLGPTGYGNSPYAALSAFAGNPLMIDLESLVAAGLLTPDELEPARGLPAERVDFGEVCKQLPPLVRKAWQRFRTGPAAADREDFHQFCDAEAAWLNDWARFAALKQLHDDKPWTDWSPALVARDPAALAALEQEHGDLIGAAKFAQWLFDRQWSALRSYAAERGVRLVGDMPIFVAHDSADVWAHPGLFQLDGRGRPTVVAGVPPDYFSETGQLWGNPLYRWDVMKQNGYAWWVARMRRLLAMVDVVRIDHFRGFEACWEIPGDAEVAVHGRWVPGPGADFFKALNRNLGKLPLIAEDLGVITEPVEALRDDFELPGMRVLQFAFGGESDQPFLPHLHIPNSVCYLGTHDNDTTVGWLADLRRKAHEGAVLEPLAPGTTLSKADKTRRDELEAAVVSWRHLHDYLDLTDAVADQELCRRLIRLALGSVSETAILSFQDIPGLGSEARMNTPSKPEGNWEWRCTEAMLDSDAAARLLRLTRLYGRADDPASAAADNEEAS